MLKIVGIPRLDRTGATLAMPWWNAGANRKHSVDDETIAGTLLESTLCSWTPRFVIKSPEPDDEVAALPPCLLTLSPIPAPTIAADVDTLKVFCPSPPVPTTSIYPSGSTVWPGIMSENLRMVSTAVAMYSESNSKPRILNAVRNEASSTSLVFPWNTSVRAAAKSSVVNFSGELASVRRYKIVSKEGATFTIMLAGESGLGKTTFINTLFQTSLKTHPELRNRLELPIKKTVEVDIVRAELEEKNFKLNLNVVDTPGFGDNVNNKNAWQPIIDFIDDQHHSFLKQETQPLRASRKDLRVHAVLYFIRPTGHTLKPLDIEVMKKLGTRANLIPVIAKADTLTPNEMIEFKKRIREIIEVQDIRIYSPPIEADDQAASEHAKQLIESMPFSVIGSEEEFEVDGAFVRGRKYPWGFVDVENDQHCDFRKLRSLILRTNMLDLILSTKELHYETFRTLKMQDDAPSSSDSTTGLDKKVDRFSSNPKFVEEERRIKRYFAEQLRNEDQRFKQWKQNIHTEKNRLNHDLATLQSELKTLEDQVKALKEKKGRI